MERMLRINTAVVAPLGSRSVCRYAKKVYKPKVAAKYMKASDFIPDVNR